MNNVMNRNYQMSETVKQMHINWPLGGSMHSWEVKMEMCLKELGCKLNELNLADRIQSQVWTVFSVSFLDRFSKKLTSIQGGCFVVWFSELFSWIRD
jgi:hypothetical protein